ncbi:MAG: hypothetical protein LC650_00725 [Actinobacteria bacterium]|nr:hypothetical protein [Actinomycetota bacterium]
MAVKTIPTRIVYREAIDVQVGDSVDERRVLARKVYRKRAESFRRVRLSFDGGTVREYRERFRVPVRVLA